MCSNAKYIDMTIKAFHMICIGMYEPVLASIGTYTKADIVRKSMDRYLVCIVHILTCIKCKTYGDLKIKTYTVISIWICTGMYCTQICIYWFV